jgi:hypothetical protein
MEQVRIQSQALVMCQAPRDVGYIGTSPNSLPHLAPCMHEPLLRSGYRDHIKDLATTPALAQGIAGDLAKRSSLGFTIVA